MRKAFKKFLSAKKNLVLMLTCLIIAVGAIAFAFATQDKATKSRPFTPATQSSVASPTPDTGDSTVIPQKMLEINTPSNTVVDTKQDTFVFTGSSDAASPLKINGKDVSRDEQGTFSVTVQLKKGKNSFTFEHKGQSIVYTVNYKYVVINNYSPSKAQSFNSGSVIVVNVSARAGSNITAEFNGKTINLKKTDKQNEDNKVSDDTFCDFTGSFTLPNNNARDISLGKIKFTASYDGTTETYYSGKIMVKKNSSIKLKATVICRSAETFNGNTTDDYSRPVNNYLPKGTVDYCDEGYITNGDETYVKLRCGRRVYLTCNPGKSYEYEVVDISTGTLPDHNEITFKSMTDDGKYTTLKLGCMWKAPFLLELKNQTYKNANSQNYTFDKATFSYVDIKFCYSTVFNGEFTLPENNEIFKSYEIIKNKDSYTLRLHLKKVGGFYGWDSFYDDEGNLNFKFLNPVKMESSTSLNGITIYIDVGHGGSDVGAGAYNGSTNEAVRNLVLAKKLKSKLEAIGATVQLSRYDNNTTLTPLQKMNDIRDSGAHFCIAIHHDSNAKGSLNGFGAYHFTQYSQNAADFIDKTTDNTKIYQTNTNVRFHYYYGSRITNCPAVLTENGFMSNKNDFNDIVDDQKNEIKAQALADGILKYFVSIQ